MQMSKQKKLGERPLERKRVRLLEHPLSDLAGLHVLVLNQANKVP